MAIRDRILGLKQVHISKIRGFSGGNPKKRSDADRKQLGDSIDNHGYVLPIAVRMLLDGTYEVLDGHGRIEQIIQRDPDAKLKVIVLDVESVAEGRRILLALQHVASWDMGELNSFVRAGFDEGLTAAEMMADTGFTGAELDAFASAGDDILGGVENGGTSTGGREIEVNGHTRVIGAHKVRPPVQMTHDDWVLHHGDSAVGLAKLADNSIDALVTDPPSGIAFMGAEWDKDKGGRDKWIAWLCVIMQECYRVLKPGAYGLVWALPRTSHWTAMALENAGLEVRDRVSHLFLSGFPKSLDASKAIDAKLGASNRRPVVGTGTSGIANAFNESGESYPTKFDRTGSATAAAWEGWGTALKPALEDWWLIRKPPEGTIAENILKWGVGAINIDACRVGDEGGSKAVSGALPPSSTNHDARIYGNNMGGAPSDPNVVIGRWPSHLTVGEGVEINDVELPALYFYCPKPAKSETEAGLGDFPESTGGEATGRTDGSAGLNNPRAGAGRNGGRRNTHPTKKPIELMRWLIRLITPSNGRVLDPFSGSGTTGLAALVEGCRFVGWEQEEKFHRIATARLRSIIDDPRNIETADDEPAEPVAEEAPVGAPKKKRKRG